MGLSGAGMDYDVGFYVCTTKVALSPNGESYLIATCWTKAGNDVCKFISSQAIILSPLTEMQALNELAPLLPRFNKCVNILR